MNAPWFGRVIFWLVTAVLAGCTIPLGNPGPEPSQEARAACNARADQEYLSQHRDAVYRADRYTSELRDTPFATNGLPESNGADLSAQYERNQDVRNCLNGGADTLDPAGPAPAR